LINICEPLSQVLVKGFYRLKGVWLEQGLPGRQGVSNLAILGRGAFNLHIPLGLSGCGCLIVWILLPGWGGVLVFNNEPTVASQSTSRFDPATYEGRGSRRCALHHYISFVEVVLEVVELSVGHCHIGVSFCCPNSLVLVLAPACFKRWLWHQQCLPG
jgi:hypothetical protein